MQMWWGQSKEAGTNPVSIVFPSCLTQQSLDSCPAQQHLWVDRGWINADSVCLCKHPRARACPSFAAKRLTPSELFVQSNKFSKSSLFKTTPQCNLTVSGMAPFLIRYMLFNTEAVQMLPRSPAKIKNRFMSLTEVCSAGKRGRGGYLS